MKKILVSACLLGCETRYDGKSKPCKKVLDLAGEKCILIPVCPEQMGGLCTPRVPSERQKGQKVLMKDGTDVSANYKKGAKMALEIAKLNNVDFAILKQGSPSCGKGLIYDGSFTGKKKEGNGVTTDLLLKNGIKVISEDEL